MTIGRDIIEPPSHDYLGYRLNEYNGLVGIFEYKGDKGVLQKKSKSSSESSSETDFSSIVGGAPEELDTLGEIATALSSKEDKISGKGLSTNDYTNADKEKVANAYIKPQTGVPGTDLAVLTLIGLPSTGSYSTNDFEAAVCSITELTNMSEGKYILAKSGNNYYLVSGGKTSSSVFVHLTDGNSLYSIEYASIMGMAVVSVTKLKDKEDKGNKVTVWNPIMSDASYPSEKLVKIALNGKENTSNKVTSLSSQSTDTQYPSAKCVYDAFSTVNPERIVSMDFGINEIVIDGISSYDSITINKVVASNCATIKISYGNVTQQTVTPGTVDFTVLAGEPVVGEITRTDVNSNALVGFKFDIN